MPRLANARRVKLHWNYTVPEAARACRVSEGAVRGWFAQGLQHTEGRPTLVRGCDLKAFLSARNVSRKQPLGPTEFYCLPCGGARSAAEGMTDYTAKTDTVGTLSALCPTCSTVMNRIISKASLHVFEAEMDVSAHEVCALIKGLDQSPR
ncbi:MAG: hypothetical protein AB8B88_00640 [Devosiaceae bacterium]